MVVVLCDVDLEIVLVEVEVKDIFYYLEYVIVCENVLVGKFCIDGCELNIVCLIVVEVGVMFRMYGFVLFI